MPRLTKRVVEAAETRPVDYFIWCSDLAGFGIRVMPSGKRSYVAQYRAEGRSRRAVLGFHGPLTADEGRRMAMSMLGEVAKGGNPAEERATRRNSLTVVDLCDRYLQAAERGLIGGKGGVPKKASTLREDRSRIARHILPLLGKRLVRDLKHADVARFIRDVTDGATATTEKTARLRGKAVVRGGIGIATRTAGLLGGILSFAVAEGVIAANPATGVRKPGSRVRTLRFAAAEYAGLGNALADEAAAGMNPHAVAVVRLVALTGCRKAEATGLRWSEVDTAGQALRLADSKEGASVRPAGRSALAVLESVERQAGVDWVFPGERRDVGPYGGLKGAWAKLIRRAGLTGFTIHTLRHSFASVAGDLGYSESTIAAMLGHAAGSVTGRYTHHLDSVLIAAADKVSAEIDRLMQGANIRT